MGPGLRLATLLFWYRTWGGGGRGIWHVCMQVTNKTKHNYQIYNYLPNEPFLQRLFFLDICWIPSPHLSCWAAVMFWIHRSAQWFQPEVSSLKPSCPFYQHRERSQSSCCCWRDDATCKNEIYYFIAASLVLPLVSTESTGKGAFMNFNSVEFGRSSAIARLLIQMSNLTVFDMYLPPPRHQILNPTFIGFDMA